ncbi:MAG: Fe-S cluster assembly protein SufD, partial [Pseudomonadota bacterium]
MTLSKAKQDVTDALMAHFPAPIGSDWLSKARAAATARVNAMGLPIARDEYWKYTSPAPMNAPDPAYQTKSP